MGNTNIEYGNRCYMFFPCWLISSRFPCASTTYFQRYDSQTTGQPRCYFNWINIPIMIESQRASFISGYYLTRFCIQEKKNIYTNFACNYTEMVQWSSRRNKVLFELRIWCGKYETRVSPFRSMEMHTSLLFTDDEKPYWYRSERLCRNNQSNRYLNSLFNPDRSTPFARRNKNVRVLIYEICTTHGARSISTWIANAVCTLSDPFQTRSFVLNKAKRKSGPSVTKGSLTRWPWTHQFLTVRPRQKRVSQISKRSKLAETRKRWEISYDVFSVTELQENVWDFLYRQRR